MRVRRQRTAADDNALVVLRSVCHELRPPMATLSSLMRAIEDHPTGERREQLTRLAAEHAAHAQSVLSEAATIAAGLTAGLTDRPGGSGPLDEVLPSVLATVPDDRLSIGLTREARLWPVHQQHTRQILINLVGNAARYSAGTIRLSARRSARRLRLMVADEGGPTPDLLRALGRPTAPADNNGLGLWVVRHLTAAHGGRVRARASRPVGLIMEVLLPRYHG